MNDDLSRRLREQVALSTPPVPPPYDAVLGMRARRRTRRRANLAAASVALMVASVAIAAQVTRGEGSGPPAITPTTTAATTSADPRPWPTYTWSKKPSPLVLRLADRDASVAAESYCWNGPVSADRITKSECARGLAPQPSDLVDTGSPDAIEFWFGRPGWKFEASFTELGVACPREESSEAVATGDQTFRLEPAGLSGRYRINLFGRGDAGTASYSFVWETPSDGPLDQPSGYIDWARDGQEAGDGATSYAIEIGINDLATHPTRGHARVTGTAANGKNMTMDVPLIRPSHTPCTALGTFYFQTDDPATEDLLELGPAPYSYAVEITVDGKSWTATGAWPGDQIHHRNHPSTALEFTPALPAYTGE